MEPETFKKELEKRAKQFGIDLSEQQQNQFYQYMRTIIRMESKNKLNSYCRARRDFDKAFYR